MQKGHQESSQYNSLVIRLHIISLEEKHCHNEAVPRPSRCPQAVQHFLVFCPRDAQRRWDDLSISDVDVSIQMLNSHKRLIIWNNEVQLRILSDDGTT